MLLKLKNICKAFGAKAILHNIELEIEQGEVLGLLGENGAGKSTCMQIIAGCLPADSGSIQLNGIEILDNPTKYKSQIGYLPDIPPLYPEMHVAQYLRFAAKIRGVTQRNIEDHLEYALEQCQLTKKRNERITHLSKGYKQRVGIAQAIIHRPPLVILDEPTVGLDPKQLDDSRNLIRQLAHHSGIILSTHIMQEVEALCDTVSVIKNQNIVLHQPVSSITSLQDIFFE